MARKQRPLLSICMIVKDEEANLPRALRSVRGLADEIVVVDTGSTDGTVAVARSFGAKIVHFPWIGDFAAARNAGLEKARAEWAMVLDADEELKAEDRDRVRPLLLGGQAEAYICPVISLLGGDGGLDFEHSMLLRFWRNREEHRYTGLMHEDLSPSIIGRNPAARLENAPIRFVHYGYLQAAEVARGKKERNLALIEAQVAQHPESPFYRFNLGVEYQRHERFADALVQYEQVRAAAAGAPWEPKWTKNLIYCLLHTNRTDDAVAEIDAALGRFPDFTDLLYLRGVAEVDRADYPRAVGTFSQCVAMGPAPVPPHAGAEEGLGAWKAYYALGQAYQLAGRPHEAVVTYEQAVALRPEWVTPLQAIAGVLLSAGVTPEKVRGYLEGKLPAKMPGRQLVLARMMVQGGAPAQALELLPDDLHTPEADYLRGTCKLKLGDWDGAAAALERVPAGHETRPGAVAGLAYCHWCRGNEEAVAAALAELGDNEEARLQGARLFVDAAQDVLARGLARFPDSGPLRDLLERLRREAP